MGTPLKSPPVFFTAVEIRHNALAALEKELPEPIREGLRKEGFSDYQATQAITLQIQELSPNAQNGPPLRPIVRTRSLVYDFERTSGFVIESNRFVFLTTAYMNFDLLLRRVHVVGALLHESVGINFVERIGLRYLNVVIPKEGSDDISTHVRAGAMGLTPELADDDQVGRSFCECQFQRPSVPGVVIAKSIIQHGELTYPADMDGAGLKPDRRLGTNLGIHAVLDIDTFVQERMRYENDAIDRRLTQLHNNIWHTLDSCVTDEAKASWDR